jgi:non-ribosomal peptide synthase protein (TIGR01720 family)
MPNKGLAYGLARHLCKDEALAARFASLPAAQVAFNYIGRIDGMLNRKGSWKLDPKSTGASNSQRDERSHVLAVTAWVADDRLHWNLEYGGAQLDESVVRGVARSVEATLDELIAAASGADAREFTEADLAEVGWSSEDLEDLLQED